MIFIDSDIQLHEDDIKFEFMKASGPGGQNVNKVNTAVLLRFDVDQSSLPENVKTRLKSLYRKYVSEAGILLIQAKRYRSQAQNRQDAIERLVGWIQKAAIKPKRRIKTNIPTGVKNLITREKQHRSRLKQTRRTVKEDMNN